MDRFHNKDGSLTRYAFACGYVQRETIGNVEVSLYQDGCWHVRYWLGGTRHWDTFDRLYKARKRYREVCAVLKRKVSRLSNTGV